MLVLARKLGQSIIIDGCTEVTIVEVRGEQVRLGVTAPKTISVYRKELLERIKVENIAAALSAGAEDLEDITGKINESNTKNRPVGSKIEERQ